MKPAMALAALLCAVLVSGCGEEVKAPDLFIVYRAGSTPGAELTLLVNEEGGVHCNGRRAPMLSDPQLIKARTIAEELQNASEHHLTLAARAGSVFSYYVRDEHGWVRFADNSVSQPRVLRELQLFVVQSAQQLCHLQGAEANAATLGPNA